MQTIAYIDKLIKEFTSKRTEKNLQMFRPNVASYCRSQLTRKSIKLETRANMIHGHLGARSWQTSLYNKFWL